MCGRGCRRAYRCRRPITMGTRSTMPRRLAERQQTVAQNHNDLNAEEGNSSFDVRQKLTGNWVFELPFGPNRALLSKGGFWSKALDGFSLSGDFTFATGTYYTPNYQLTVQETASGLEQFVAPESELQRSRSAERRQIGTGSIRRRLVTPPAGQYGTASRNSIEGPGIVVVDVSLSRTVQLGETRSFEARVTASKCFEYRCSTRGLIRR